MNEIRNYIALSKTAININGTFSHASQFKEFYDSIEDCERKSLISHFIINNIPYAFKDKPMLYERVIQYIADKLDITTTEIKLIGSAKTGFSLSPLPTYGKQFGEHSDLDFSIVNLNLFNSLRDEFLFWSSLFKEEKISSKNEVEESYWNQNLENVPRQLKNGFIDTHFIPNRQQFPTTRKINQTLWLIRDKLDNVHNIKVKKASVRIYKSWDSFTTRLITNTELVMSSLGRTKKSIVVT